MAALSATVCIDVACVITLACFTPLSLAHSHTINCSYKPVYFGFTACSVDHLLLIKKLYVLPTYQFCPQTPSDMSGSSLSWTPTRQQSWPTLSSARARVRLPRREKKSFWRCHRCPLANTWRDDGQGIDHLSLPVVAQAPRSVDFVAAHLMRGAPALPRTKSAVNAENVATTSECAGLAVTSSPCLQPRCPTLTQMTERFSTQKLCSWATSSPANGRGELECCYRALRRLQD